MEWIERSKNEPDPKKYEYILVLGKCKKPHVAYREFDDWVHTECCYDDGTHFCCASIEFDWWMPIEIKKADD